MEQGTVMKSDEVDLIIQAEFFGGRRLEEGLKIVSR